MAIGLLHQERVCKQQPEGLVRILVPKLQLQVVQQGMGETHSVIFSRDLLGGLQKNTILATT
jgi:hypothetical protein